MLFLLFVLYLAADSLLQLRSKVSPVVQSTVYTLPYKIATTYLTQIDMWPLRAICFYSRGAASSLVHRPFGGEGS
jgi:hypothetical protein